MAAISVITDDPYEVGSHCHDLMLSFVYLILVHHLR